MTAACGSRIGVAARWWPSTWMVEARWSLLAAPAWVGPSTGCPTAGCWSLARNSLGSSRTAPPYAIAPQGGNELVVDPAGHVYVDGADFDFVGGGAPEPGWIRLIDDDGTAHDVAGDIDFPNGMVITPDGSTLVIAESFAGRLSAFDIAGDGSLSNRRTWADGLGPDGICIDPGGGIWAQAADTFAHSHPPGAPAGAVVRVLEGGEITHRVETALPCFACGLGGPEGRHLFLLCNEFEGVDQLQAVLSRRSARIYVTEVPV